MTPFPGMGVRLLPAGTSDHVSGTQKLVSVGFEALWVIKASLRVWVVTGFEYLLLVRDCEFVFKPGTAS